MESTQKLFSDIFELMDSIRVPKCSVAMKVEPAKIEISWVWHGGSLGTVARQVIITPKILENKKIEDIIYNSRDKFLEVLFRYGYSDTLDQPTAVAK